MTVEEIFSQLVAHMKKGIMMHEHFANIYSFLNLYGYAKSQEYHYYEEIQGCRELQNYYLSHYNKLILKLEYEKINLIPENWYKYTSTEVDTNTRRSMIQNIMKQWVKWETETKQLMEKLYKELYDLNEICAAQRLIKFLKSVDKELKAAREKYINFESINYDIVSITEEQEHYKNEYQKKIDNLFK